MKKFAVSAELPGPQVAVSLPCAALAFRVLRSSALLLALLFLSHGSVAARDRVDFSQYDDPLYEQVVERIQAKVASRLEQKHTSHDRYFIIPFAYQNSGNDPEFSHSFISVIRVFGAGRKPSSRSEMMTGSYKGWRFEAFNISWIPEDFLENPHLCVFSGFGSRLFPGLNKCPLSVGKNFSLRETLAIAANAKVAVGMWGPYEVRKEAFDLAVNRKRLLDGGTIKYRADDRIYRMNRVAINCFHDMGGLDELFPNGGLFGTGFKMWGLNGTSRVLIEYTTRANRRGLLLDPVDVKRDRYGFVYAPYPNARRGVYNPFKSASAYRR